MAYGYGNKPNWKLQAEKQAQNGGGQGVSAQNVGVQRDSEDSKASFDAKSGKVVLPAQLNVKHLGQWAGTGYRRESKFGPMLVISLEQAVPAGSKLLVTPRRKFPKSLG